MPEFCGSFTDYYSHVKAFHGCPTHDMASFDVRYLDGGAWDRLTWYGNACTQKEAAALASEKLMQWRMLSSRPSVLMDDFDRVLVVRMARRPRRDHEVLFEAKSFDKAQRFIERQKVN